MKKLLNIQLLLLLTFTSSLYAWKFDDKLEEYKEKKEQLRGYQRDVEDRYSQHLERGFDEYVDGDKAVVKSYVDNERKHFKGKLEDIQESTFDYSEYEDGDNLEEYGSKKIRKRYDNYEEKTKIKFNKRAQQYSNVVEQIDEVKDEDLYNLYSDESGVENLELDIEESVDDSINLYDNIYSDVEEEIEEKPSFQSTRYQSKRVEKYEKPYSDDIYIEEEEYKAPYTKKVKPPRERVKPHRRVHVDFKDTKLGKSARYYKKSLNNRVKRTRSRVKKRLDRDKDGVIDAIDRCAHTPSGVRVKRDGCPFDRDRDGIFDYKDRCLKTPFNTKVDKNGCSKKVIYKLLTLKFKKGTNQINYNSFASIKKFTNFMKNNPKYRAEIIGYTDDRGKERDNLKLSKRRAEATKEAMIIEGIDASRMKVIAKGSQDPMYSNRTKQGREKNNRIEVKLYD